MYCYEIVTLICRWGIIDEHLVKDGLNSVQLSVSFHIEISHFISTAFDINHHGAEISVIWLVDRSAINLLILYVNREKQILTSREISVLTLHWQYFSKSVLDHCFLTPEKEDNTVKLRQ